MDKITRLLLLYLKLLQGEKINKLSFCIDTEISPRTFDRDIEDIRLYLSDFFYTNELIFDYTDNTYSFSNTQRHPIEMTEYLFIEQILLDTGVLRHDEMKGLLTHLAQNTDDRDRMLQHKIESLNSYKGSGITSSILKMNEDLHTIILNKSVIEIKYRNDEMKKHIVIPCMLKYNSGFLYLLAYHQNDDSSVHYFRIDKIDSFSVIREQSLKEMHQVNVLLEKMHNDPRQNFDENLIDIILICRNEYYPFVINTFQSIVQLGIEKGGVRIKIRTAEDKFLKWILSQSIQNVRVLSPPSIKAKMISKANKIIEAYMEV